MISRSAAITLSTAAVAVGFASAAADPPIPPAPSVVIARPADVGDPGFIRSRAARLIAGQRLTLLALRRIGRLKVACGADRRTQVSFRAAHLLPTSDLVVSSPTGAFGARLQPSQSRSRPPGAVIAQTWQIAPFASGGVRVTTVHVTARPIPGGCAASAMAIVGPDQGNTITGEG